MAHDDIVIKASSANSRGTLVERAAETFRYFEQGHSPLNSAADSPVDELNHTEATTQQQRATAYGGSREVHLDPANRKLEDGPGVDIEYLEHGEDEARRAPLWRNSAVYAVACLLVLVAAGFIGWYAGLILLGDGEVSVSAIVERW